MKMKRLNELTEEPGFLKRFLTPSKDVHIDTIDRRGIESLLYDIKDKEQIHGRAIHIGDGYFLTAFHVIEDEETDLQLFPQLIHDNRLRRAGNFKVITTDTDSDLALLRIHNHEKSDAPLIRLFDRIPELGESVSEFIRYDGNKVNTDYAFQFEHEHIPKLGRIILRANSPLLEKQGEVEYNSNNPHYPRYVHTFGAPIPTLFGDSGSPVFVKVDMGKYTLVGIASKIYGDLFRTLTPNHPFFNKDGYSLGSIVIDREAIERVISQYLAKANQTPHPPSQ